MRTVTPIILLVVCVGVNAFSKQHVPQKDIAFKGGKLRGQAFDNLDEFKKDLNPYRLPNTTLPVHYDVSWKIVGPPTMAFSGTVDIYLQATQPNVSEIVIHSDSLSIESLKLQLGDNVINQTHSFDNTHQFLIIKLQSGHLEYNDHQPIYYRLSISFNASITTDATGIYSTSYTSNGTVHWVVSTQFRTISARSAFPCYDEPVFKTTFDITITRPVHFKSWSFTRQKESRASVDAGYEDDVYHTTPEMSTFMLAFIVAEYDSVGRYDVVNGSVEVTYEIIGRSEVIQSKDQWELAFELVLKSLALMREYTGIDFYSINPNIKLTQAAISDDGAGSTYWGLPLYREHDLFYVEGQTTIADKRFIQMNVAFDIAYQWFGCLVSFDFWDISWISEGFSVYFQYYINYNIDPSQGFLSSFVTDELLAALLADASDYAGPLTSLGIGNPTTIASMDSTITYSKGAAIFRMTAHLMGSENHKEGLQKYVRLRAFKTTTPMDLFETLQETALETGAIAEYGPDFSIVDYYKSWTEQAGHPVLDVYVDRQTGAVKINQRRFHINVGYSAVEAKWVIPISFATASDPDFLDTKPTHIVYESNTTLDLQLGCDEWIILNKQYTGFYRVNYDDYSWDLIAQQLSSPDRELVHEHNRAQIVYDVFSLARSGIMNYNKAFHILSFLEDETAYTPWKAAVEEFKWLFNRIVGTSLEKPFQEMVLEWASSVMSDLTYLGEEGESDLRSELRSTMATTMCQFGAENCRETALNVFEDLYYQGIEVPLESRDWVYCNALRDGGPEYYQFLYDRQLNASASEQYQILVTLGCTTDEASLNHLLDTIVHNQQVVRPEQMLDVYNIAVIGNEVNTNRVYHYIQENLNAVNQTFQSLWLPFAYVSSRLRSVEDIIEFRAWATQHEAELGDDYYDIFNRASNSAELLAFEAKVHNDMNSYLMER